MIPGDRVRAVVGGQMVGVPFQVRRIDIDRGWLPCALLCTDEAIACIHLGDALSAGYMVEGAERLMRAQ